MAVVSITMQQSASYPTSGAGYNYIEVDTGDILQVNAYYGTYTPVSTSTAINVVSSFTDPTGDLPSRTGWNSSVNVFQTPEFTTGDANGSTFDFYFFSSNPSGWKGRVRVLVKPPYNLAIYASNGSTLVFSPDYLVANVLKTTNSSGVIIDEVTVAPSGSANIYVNAGSTNYGVLVWQPGSAANFFYQISNKTSSYFTIYNNDPASTTRTYKFLAIRYF